MAYGIVKVDNITFDNGGSDQNVTVSGLYRATTSGVTVSGTIAAGTVSGITVIGSTTVSGATVTGTTANFTSGNFSNLISAAATMSGALIMANQQQVRFREAVGNGVNHIALQAPAIVSADQTITLPDQTGTVVTTGDNGSVTSTMILDGTILNADINASAAIADTKLATISTAGKVSGTAITSGTIDTSGSMEITNTTPALRLAESDGTSTNNKTALIRNSDIFVISTRDSTDSLVSADYSIPSDASGATDHIWRIANTEKARLNSAGLTVVNDLTITDKIIHAGDTDTAIRFPAANTVAVETGGTEAMRIDSGGRLLVGTSSARQSRIGAGSFQTQFQLESEDATAGLATSRFNDAAGSSFVNLQKGRGTIASPAAVIANDITGTILFSGWDGAAFTNSALIRSEVDGTPGADDMPGRLVFSTTADGSAVPTEAMRINSAQELLIGYTADNGAYKLQVNSQIFATSATVATSDGRYKENVATLNGCIDLVNALRPVSFDWKPQQDITRIDEDGNSVLVREGHNFPDGKQVGFIAQEVQEVLADKPWLGSVIKQNVRPAIEDADGNELAPEEEFFGIAEGNLTAVLTAALQEAIAKINALEARIAALEA
jgi:hypothetical protein